MFQIGVISFRQAPISPLYLGEADFRLYTQHLVKIGSVLSHQYGSKRESERVELSATTIIIMPQIY